VRRALALLALTTCAPRLPALGVIEGVRPWHLRDVPPEALGETVSVSVREYVDDSRWVHGEMLACDPQAIYVLLHLTTRRTYLTLPWRAVRQVRLGEVPGNALLPTWTTLGALSSISHGFYAGFSFPAWLGVGIPLSVMGNDARPRMSNCEELRASARFPQGLPAAFRVAHFTAPTEARAPRRTSVGAMGAPWATHDAGATEDVAPREDALAEEVVPDDTTPAEDAGAPADT
jgi:hypothetical protein